MDSRKPKWSEYIISVSIGDDKVAWYKNNTLSISENEVSNYTVYPNPTRGVLYIKSKLPISQISVYTILGQLVESISETNQVDLSKAEAGVYLLKIEDESYQTFKRIK